MVNVSPLLSTEISICYDDIHTFSVYGLAIYSWADLSVAAHDDPRVILINALAKELSCSAIIGSYYVSDIAGSIGELLKPAGIEFVDSRIGLAGGTFYAGDNAALSAFVPNLPDDVSIINSGGSTTPEIVYLFECDSFAILVNMTSEGRKRIEYLITNPPQELFVALYPEQAGFIRELVHYCDLLIVFEADGNAIQAFSRNAAMFDILEKPIERASNSITSSEWFLANQSDLVWDEYLWLCLARGTKAV